MNISLFFLCPKLKKSTSNKDIDENKSNITSES